FDQQYRLGDSYRNYSHTFSISQNGNYTILFSVIPAIGSQNDYDTATVLFDNAVATPAYEDETDITFDTYTRTTNTGITAVQRYEKTIYFADSRNSGDLGQLKY